MDMQNDIVYNILRCHARTRIKATRKGLAKAEEKIRRQDGIYFPIAPQVIPMTVIKICAHDDSKFGVPGSGPDNNSGEDYQDKGS